MSMKEKFDNNKFILFLRKTDPLILVLHVVWSYFTLMLPLFTEYESLIIDIPEAVVNICCVLIGIAAIVIKILYFRNKEDIRMKIVYITFFCFAPIAICLLQFLLVHFIYDFSGVFLGGLGLAIVSAFAVILCIGALGVSFIAVCIKKYLAKKGKTIDKDRFTVIKDIINIIGVIALVIAGVIYISIYSVEFVKEKKYEKLNVKDIYCETYEDYFREHRY